MGKRDVGAKQPADEKEAKFIDHLKKIHNQIGQIRNLANQHPGVVKPLTEDLLYKDCVLDKSLADFKASFKKSLKTVAAVTTDPKGVAIPEDKIDANVNDVVDDFCKDINTFVEDQFKNLVAGNEFDEAKWNETFNDPKKAGNFRTGLDAALKKARDKMEADFKAAEIKIPPVPVQPTGRPPIHLRLTTQRDQEQKYQEAEKKYLADQKAYYEAKQKHAELQPKLDEAFKQKRAQLDEFAKNQAQNLEKFAKDALYAQMEFLAERRLAGKLEVDQGKAHAEQLDRQKFLTSDWNKVGEPPKKVDGIVLGKRTFLMEDGLYEVAGFTQKFSVKKNKISGVPPLSGDHPDFMRVNEQIVEKLMTSKGAEAITLDYDSPENAAGDLKAIEKLVTICEKRGIPIVLGDNAMMGLVSKHPGFVDSFVDDASRFLSFMTRGKVERRPAGPPSEVTSLLARIQNLQKQHKMRTEDGPGEARLKQMGLALEALERDNSKNEDLRGGAGNPHDEAKFKEAYKKAILTENGAGLTDLKDDKKVEQVVTELKSIEKAVEDYEATRSLATNAAISFIHEAQGNPNSRTLKSQQKELGQLLLQMDAKELDALKHRAEVLREVKVTDPAQKALFEAEANKINGLTGRIATLLDEFKQPEGAAYKKILAAEQYPLDEARQKAKEAEIKLAAQPHLAEPEQKQQQTPHRLGGG